MVARKIIQLTIDIKTAICYNVIKLNERRNNKMRYMVQTNSNEYLCFNDEETKSFYESIGYWVMDMENLYI